ncbi:hypothetical protein [Roseivirga pacifica]|uniref:hypothetical protein n=1 Tax=Roseivirga pacifica TaxID=1267423 RepID=UPI003BB0CBF1
MNKLISTLTLCLVSYTLSAQTEWFVEEDFLNKEFINQTFEGGNDGYISFFKEHLSFPETSYKDQIEGLLLFSFTVDTQREEVDVIFYTKLDKHIEAQVNQTIQASRNKWSFGREGKYTFYQPIVYSLLPYYPHTLEGNLPELPAALPLKYLQLFVLVKSKRIPEGLDVNETNETIASERQKTVYTRTEAAFHKAFEAGRNEIAYQLLNKLIRYNPLNRELLLKRISLEKQIEVNDYQAYDARLLEDFVDTYTPPKGTGNSSAGFKSAASINTLTEGKSAINIVLDSLYKGGYSAYVTDFATLFQLPAINYIAQTNGVMLIEIKSNINGVIDAQLLTPFDSPVGEAMETFLKYAFLKWKKTTTPLHKVQPVFISKDEFLHKSLRALIPDYHLLSAPIFLQPTEVTGFMTAPIYDNDIPKLDKNQQQELMASSPLYAEYLAATQGLSKQLEKGKDKKILKALNRVIQLNPFNIELIKKRVEVMGANALESDQKLIDILTQANKKP